jgi:IS30 family transposase
MKGYVAPQAHLLAKSRKKSASKRARLKCSFIRDYTKEKLHLGWSPEQIAARLPMEYRNYSISHEAIYQYIYYSYFQGIPLLARRHPKRYSKNYSRKRLKFNIPERISILDRPAKINKRTLFGHWESDSLESKQSRAIINILVERKSRYIFLKKISTKTAEMTQEAIISNLVNLPPWARRSITYDNGIENYWHHKINHTLKTTSYFCQPYHSWEKGTVENTNGLIRRIFPKKTDWAKVSLEQLEQLEQLLNNRPRKCLNFKTPAEVFTKFCGALAL